MQIKLDEAEAWSLMTLVTAQVLDQVELGDDAADAIRDWRAGLEEGSPPMEAFAAAVNEALGHQIDEELTRTVRRRDYYRKVR